MVNFNRLPTGRCNDLLLSDAVRVVKVADGLEDAPHSLQVRHLF